MRRFLSLGEPGVGSAFLVTVFSIFGCSSPDNKASATSASGGTGSSLGGALSSSGGQERGSGGAAQIASGGAQPGGSGGSGTLAGSGGAASTSGATLGASGAPSGGMGGASPAAKECPALPKGSVTYSVPSGAFEGTLNVTLSTSLAGAEIRYTTDHSVPTAASTLYTGTPIAMSATTQLIAQAFTQGVAVGEPEAGIYIARNFDAIHDLPVIVLDSYGTALPGQATSGGKGGATMANNDFVNVALLSFEPSGGMTSLSATPRVASSAGFHIRGQSSANYDKKPYRVELRKVDGTDRDCAMLGMPGESDWVLHSPFPDKALIRNAFVYSLGPDMGLKAPRAAFAEVYVNSAARPLESSDYQGVYLLVETIKNQKDRLNLQQLKETDTTLPAIAGGYIFKFEWQVSDIGQKLVCPSGQQNCWDFLEVADPDPWNQRQQDFLTQYLRSFVTGLHSATPADPTTGYPAFMDVPSFVNQVILHELTRNLDAYTRSQYFYKDRDGKMNAGPLWDYDLTAGVGSGNTALTGWQYESIASRFRTTADWFPVLIAEPTFKAAVIARWKELRQSSLSDAAVSARIVRLTTGLANGAQRNFQKWNNLTTARIGFFQTPTAATWDEQVKAMQSWLLGRMAWLDMNWQ